MPGRKTPSTPKVQDPAATAEKVRGTLHSIIAQVEQELTNYEAVSDKCLEILQQLESIEDQMEAVLEADAAEEWGALASFPDLPQKLSNCLMRVSSEKINALADLQTTQQQVVDKIRELNIKGSRSFVRHRHSVGLRLAHDRTASSVSIIELVETLKAISLLYTEQVLYNRQLIHSLGLPSKAAAAKNDWDKLVVENASELMTLLRLATFTINE